MHLLQDDNVLFVLALLLGIGIASIIDVLDCNPLNPRDEDAEPSDDTNNNNPTPSR